MLIPTRVSIFFMYTHAYIDSTYSYPEHMTCYIKFLAFAGGQRYIHEISWGLTLSSGGHPPPFSFNSWFPKKPKTTRALQGSRASRRPNIKALEWKPMVTWMEVQGASGWRYEHPDAFWSTSWCLVTNCNLGNGRANSYHPIGNFFPKEKQKFTSFH